MNDLFHDLDGGPDGGPGTGLEHRLRALADNVEAPAADGTRQVIGRRCRVLHRRRQVRRAAAGGALVVAAVVGAVALRHDPADVQIGPADGRGGDALPVIVLELDGWTFDSAAGYDDVGDLTDADKSAWSRSEQVFRAVGRLDGPAVYLAHHEASDVVANDPGAEIVDVNGTTGYLSTRGVFLSLRWNPVASDSEAELSAAGLDDDQVIELAESLVLRDDELQYPATPDDEFGFALPNEPYQLVEIALPDDTPPVDVHKSWYGSGEGMEAGLVEIQVDNRGERAFETGLYAPAGDTWDVFEQVEVLGEPALLRHDAIGGDWTVQWRHAEGAWVTVTVSSGERLGGVDRATVDAVIDHLRELPAGEWSSFVGD